MRALADDERPGAEEALDEAAQNLRLLLLPKDAADEKSAILEVRAGTGGDEAALFAGDLFRMYARYAELKGWKVEIISESEGTVGGYKEVVAEIKGRGVFAQPEVRERRAPGAARARHRDLGPHPHLGRDRRRAARRPRRSTSPSTTRI